MNRISNLARAARSAALNSYRRDTESWNVGATALIYTLYVLLAGVTVRLIDPSPGWMWLLVATAVVVAVGATILTCRGLNTLVRERGVGR
jgi:hypothetical protein